MTLFHWSKVAAANGNADITCPFPEGQAASTLNDGTRGMMAAVAKYRDDLSGQIVTTGTSTAYAVSSFQGFDSLNDMDGKEVWFSPHTTNAATVTINVDLLGAKPLRTAPGAEMLAGVIIQGTPYGAVYNNTDGAWYLKGFYGNPYNIPLAGGLDYWAATTPNSSFAFPIGQAISRTTYSALFALTGTTYGTGDGSTTFNLPDRRGRVSAQLDPTGTITTSFSMSPDGNSLGAKGGAQGHNITVGELPSHSHPNTLSDPGHVHGELLPEVGGGSGFNTGTTGTNTFQAGQNTQSATTGISINNAAQGGGSTMALLQPTIACNYIIRIL